MSNIKPLYDKVLLKRVDIEEKTAGGIILPDTAEKDKPKEAVVVAVGEGAVKEDGTRIPLTVKVGDKVLFSGWSNNEVKVNGEELLIIKESDIDAIIA